MKPVPAGKKGKGLRKLPKEVRNKMGFMKKGGKALKKVKPNQKGLKKLPRKVRNKMGYMKNGGSA